MDVGGADACYLLRAIFLGMFILKKRHVINAILCQLTVSIKKVLPIELNVKFCNNTI